MVFHPVFFIHLHDLRKESLWQLKNTKTIILVNDLYPMHHVQGLKKTKTFLGPKIFRVKFCLQTFDPWFDACLEKCLYISWLQLNLLYYSIKRHDTVYRALDPKHLYEFKSPMGKICCLLPSRAYLIQENSIGGQGEAETFF